DKFLPKYNPRYKLDPSENHAFGGLTTPEWYYELRYKIQSAMDEGLKEIESVGEEFGKTFGRKYGLIEEYRCDDIDTLLVMSGSMASTGKELIDKLKDDGERIGLARMRAFRPFPKQQIRKLAKNVDKIIVIDRNISFGS
ncbi:pyruvate ferredoxin oxidoreductase, partial [archaeon]|nr:pyruvate ferredoxin oxidoreductase [archaeon]